MKEAYYHFVRIMSRTPSGILSDKELLKIAALFFSKPLGVDGADPLSGNAVTVCVLWDGCTKTARGITACSKDDKFDINEAKKHSKHKALHALKKRGDLIFRRGKALSILLNVRCPFIKSAELNPDLSAYEIKLLYGRKKLFERFERPRDVGKIPELRFSTLTKLVKDHNERKIDVVQELNLA